ncbi:MAG: GNAT family N-acetyltransferase [Desulfocurvibacter africanus]
MNDEFRVSLFVPEDAPGITRFYREIYGEDFPVRYVYDPAEIVRRYDGVNHRTAVVYDNEGSLAGLGSLFRSGPNPLLYEAGQLMVAKHHRSKGVARDGILVQKLPNDPDFCAPRYGSDEARKLAEAIRLDWETVTGSD